MKLSTVGSTQAVLFEPENKREAKLLNTYVSNREFLGTKKAKTNLGVAIGTLALSYVSMGSSALAKNKTAKLGALVVGLASMVTSIGFAIKQLIDHKKFKETKEAQPFVPQEEQIGN